jgi:amidase
MSDLHELTASDQRKGLQQGDFTSRELTQHYLDRIDRIDDQLAAFVTVTADLALAEADQADERLRAGDQAPLRGLPLAIKDLQATAGVRTTLGSPALSVVPTEDSWTVGKLRQAGAVLLGKTSATEFGATCFTHNALTGAPTVTPYDVTRYASGSSAGAAAAVAAGLAPVAHASDGAGSIRTPAATCHLVGIKPSRGLVSPAPATTFMSAGTEGPMARTVQDAALLLDVMAQPSPGDLYGWRATETAPKERLKVAVWTDTGLTDTPHPEAITAVRRTTDLLRGLGHDVREIEVPRQYDDAVRDALVTFFAASLGSFVPALVADKQALTPYTRWLLARFETLTGADVLRMQSVLAAYASRFLEALDPYDVALTPTTSGPPVTVGHYTEEGVEHVADRMLAWSCYTPWVNLTGQPAISLPSHLDDAGLPYAVQLVGRPRHDRELISLAAQLESAQPENAHVHPPCWHQ